MAWYFRLLCLLGYHDWWFLDQGHSKLGFIEKQVKCANCNQIKYVWLDEIRKKGIIR